jgi:hypothetical protein
MADMLKQMCFYWQLRCTNYGIRERWADKRQSVISIKIKSSQNNYLFSTFELYSDRIQNMGRSYSILPVHQVRTIGWIKGGI